MRLAGSLMLVSGWLIALFAIVLLPAFALRMAFVLAGLAVEALGLGLLMQAYRLLLRPQR